MEGKIVLLVILALIFSFTFLGCQSENIIGSGTREDSFIIYNFEGLKMIGTRVDNEDMVYSLDAFYKLGDNIDASPTQTEDYRDGKGWKPIGNENEPFTGEFNGNEYEISNLYINRTESSRIGLFGLNKGIIKNMRLVNVKFKGDAYVGGLVGENIEGTIKNCFVEVYVTGFRCVGGLIGRNVKGKISNSYSEGIVGGSGILIGGLIGHNDYGEVINSYHK